MSKLGFKQKKDGLTWADQELLRDQRKDRNGKQVKLQIQGEEGEGMSATAIHSARQFNTAGCRNKDHKQPCTLNNFCRRCGLSTCAPNFAYHVCAPNETAQSALSGPKVSAKGKYTPGGITRQTNEADNDKDRN